MKAFCTLFHPPIYQYYFFFLLEKTNTETKHYNPIPVQI